MTPPPKKIVYSLPASVKELDIVKGIGDDLHLPTGVSTNDTVEDEEGEMLSDTVMLDCEEANTDIPAEEVVEVDAANVLGSTI